MRQYRLASQPYRSSVNLRIYTDIITDAVHTEDPSATVTVFNDYYTIDHKLKRGQVIRIGRAIASSSLGKYAISRPILFIGSDPDNKKRKEKKHAKSNEHNSRGGRPSRTPSSQYN